MLDVPELWVLCSLGKAWSAASPREAVSGANGRAGELGLPKLLEAYMIPS